MEFMRTPACCLDDWFSTWLRASNPTLADFRSGGLRYFLMSVARQVSSANMRIEGLLAEVLCGEVRVGCVWPDCPPCQF